MIKEGLRNFRGKHVLLLQGPVGPFFRRLSQDLTKAGAIVHKMNFNGGDFLFYPTKCTFFKGTPKEWPEYLESFLREKNIDTILLFGDCRQYHRVARRVSERLGVEVGVFEEGYVRPDYLTLDRSGVNAHSLLPRQAEFYRSQPQVTIQHALPVGQTIWHSSFFCVLYYTAAIMLSRFFPNYKHHRPITFSEGFPFINSFFKKWQYKFEERGIQDDLVTNFKGKYFLVPLQVYNDSQIIVHSAYLSNQDFMEEVISSFTKNAPDDSLLVLKHHPMDRGHNNYKTMIAELAHKYGLSSDRWRYIHDQHLPTLLGNSQGVVLVNSTTGLQALHHKCPLKVCGSAIYDIEGLTYKGSLDSFWSSASSFEVDVNLYEKFRDYIVTHTQLNGSIYKRVDQTFSGAGMVWPTSEVISITPDTRIEEFLEEQMLEVSEAV